MKEAVKRGLGFGLTSGVITPLGLMVGLSSTTSLKLAVIGGILTVAIADAFSDALGIHNSQEAIARNGPKAIWQATIAAFLAKFLIALSFIIAVVFLPLKLAITVNVLWGFFLLGLFSTITAKARKEPLINAISRHITIAAIVIILSYLAGNAIHSLLG